MSQPRKRILFVTENVTLAQIVRCIVLARSLDPARYDVHFACASFDPALFGDLQATRWTIHSLPKATVEAKIASGKRIYEEDVLARYVKEELSLFDKIKPDLVVGDLRMSLAISAPAAGVPCATLINAYWSPHAIRERFPLPEHPIVRMVGVEKAERYFPLALPQVFAHFVRPINALRKRHKLPELGSLLETITWGDHTLFPDVPGLIPLRHLPASHRFLGPVTWAPDIDPPAGFDALGQERPLVYVTYGSSGPVDLLPTTLEGLAGFDVDVLVSTAGRFRADQLPRNVHVADMVPGDVVAQRASLVISSGGASTAYQALAAGRPVLGVPYNLDQYLAMTAIRDAGAGILLRSGTLTAEGVRAAASSLLREPSYAREARRLAVEFARHDPLARFEQFLREALAEKRAA